MKKEVNICQQCGNELGKSPACPFCGFRKNRITVSSGTLKYSTCNLKDDMPTCEEAYRRLSYAINSARDNNVKVLKIIHGYGSTGKGGELRYCLRERFQAMTWQRRILDFLPGEDLSRSNSKGIKFLKKYPKLVNDSDFNRGNKGVTFIVL